MRDPMHRVAAVLTKARQATGRSLRIAGELRAAAHAHHAPLHRVALRAVRMQRRGWWLADLGPLGLLDPRTGPDVERWAACPGDLTRLQEQLNPADAISTAEDKGLFAEICERHGIPTPPVLATLARGANHHETVRAWAGALADAAPEEFVVKPVDGHRGIGVRVLRRTPRGAVDHVGEASSWMELAQSLTSERWPAFIVQPRYHPHPDLLALSGRDVLQTARVVTLRERDGELRVLMTILRIAVGALPIDSFRSGSTRNALATVSPEGVTTATYQLVESGFGITPMPVHPVTGAPTVGVQLPEWDAVLALVTRAAEAFAPLRAVGWDVAITDQGVVLLEANAWWAISSYPDGSSLRVLADLRHAVDEETRRAA